MEQLASTDVFGVIRKISPFRLTGTNRDLIVLASDSGMESSLNFGAVLIAILQGNSLFFSSMESVTCLRSSRRRPWAKQDVAVSLLANIWLLTLKVVLL